MALRGTSDPTKFYLKILWVWILEIFAEARENPIYSAIWSQLTGEKKTANRAAENIAKAIESKSMTEPIIMLADEIGKLLTPIGKFSKQNPKIGFKPNVIYGNKIHSEILSTWS